MTTHTFTHPVSIPLPDGTLYELDLTFTATRDSVTPGTLADASEWEVTDVALCQDNERALRTEGESDSVQVQAEPEPEELRFCDLPYTKIDLEKRYRIFYTPDCEMCRWLALKYNQTVTDSVQGEPSRSKSPIELELCETQHLFLRPNKLYLFRVDSDCAECQRLAALFD